MSSTRRSPRPIRRLAVLLAVVALVATACFEDDPTSTRDRDTSASAVSSKGRDDGRRDRDRGRQRPEIYTGPVEGFYEVPDPLPKGRPGDLIRVQRLGESGGKVNLRIMYHSRDAEKRDRAVTGLVSYPTARAPKGGWPVVSTAHGTTGIATQCAPSRFMTSAPGWGVEGVWVQTDYIGLGPIGEVHPYLSKWSEGNAVIDAVRAARQLRDAHAGRKWISIGHSQGGHGSMAAAELAKKHAPELRLVGTVALSPGAVFDKVYGGIDPIVTNILMLMALYGSVSEHPDVDVTDYVTPEAQKAAAVFETGCLDEITNALIPVGAAGPFTHDPRTTEPARSMVLANDVGKVAVKAPLFLASGTNDDRVVIERVRELYSRVCDAGQVTEFHVIEGADHGSVLPATAADVKRFMEDRLAGGPAIDSCTAPAS